MAALFCSQNLTTWGSLHMGVWKQRGLEVKRSRGLGAKPCGHLNVYVSGRLDVHRPCDPPCRGGLAIVMAGFLFAQNPMKKWYKSFNLSVSPASPSASQDIICPVHLYKTCFLRRLLRLLLRKLVFTNLACLRRLVCVALRLAKFNLRFFSDQLSLNIH